MALTKEEKQNIFDMLTSNDEGNITLARGLIVGEINRGRLKSLVDMFLIVEEASEWVSDISNHPIKPVFDWKTLNWHSNTSELAAIRDKRDLVYKIREDFIHWLRQLRTADKMTWR